MNKVKLSAPVSPTSRNEKRNRHVPIWGKVNNFIDELLGIEVNPRQADEMNDVVELEATHPATRSLPTKRYWLLTHPFVKPYAVKHQVRLSNWCSGQEEDLDC